MYDKDGNKYKFKQSFICEDCKKSMYVFGYSTDIAVLEPNPLVICNDCLDKRQGI